MLHDLFLHLLGHSSTIIDVDDEHGARSRLAPCETELLASVQRVASVHRQIRDSGLQISRSHPSIICRAVASSIIAFHLASFQKDVLDLERSILSVDGETVGAYNTVPLAMISCRFAQWIKLLDWLGSICQYMVDSEDGFSNQEHYLKMSNSRITGAAIMDRLREEGRTGYPSIKKASIELQSVAETAWLRQLSGWILYGRLPPSGTDDFFIQKVQHDDGSHVYQLKTTLLPRLVSTQTATSILFIGKSLDLVRANEHVSTMRDLTSTTREIDPLVVHLKEISALTIPLSTSALSEAISRIRISICNTKIQKLLPLSRILEVFTLLQEFFLLSRGDFAVALIAAADEQLRSVHQKSGYDNKSGSEKTAARQALSAGQINSVLAQAWANLSINTTHEHQYDDTLDQARQMLRLIVPRTMKYPIQSPRGEGSVAFQPQADFRDILLSIPVALEMIIQPPLDIFISHSDIETYSSVQAFLIAIRRAHMHLTDIWRQTSLRRTASISSTARLPKEYLQTLRQRYNVRNKEMRKIWASISSALFLLSELGGYFEQNVVGELWKSLESHIINPVLADEIDKRGVDVSSKMQDSLLSSASSIHPIEHSASKSLSYDPETLAQNHKRFLTLLVQSLFLTDKLFTGYIYSLLKNLDELAAFVYRLHKTQDILDLEEDEGVVQGVVDWAQERNRLVLELDRSRKRVDAGMKNVIGRLRALDEESSGGGLLPGLGNHSQTDYQLTQGVKGLDRLLMKLDFSHHTG